MDYEPIDVYRNDIKERLTRIETILNRELPDIKDQLKVLNGRTRSLENWRSYTLGGMVILTARLVSIPSCIILSATNLAPKYFALRGCLRMASK